MLAIAILLTLLAGALSFSVDEYAKGAARTAVEEAAQAGAVLDGSLQLCEEEGKRTLDGLLRGPLGSDINISCAYQGQQVVATGVGTLPTLVPAVPRISVSVVAVAAIQVAPGQ